MGDMKGGLNKSDCYVGKYRGGVVEGERVDKGVEVMVVK